MGLRKILWILIAINEKNIERKNLATEIYARGVYGPIFNAAQYLP